MLPEVVWNMPALGTLNLHGSLLPAYRGAAPIQWAIIKGEKTTGVTTFLLQHEIDTGKILLQREIPILDDDDAGSVHDRMMYVGAALVVSSVDQIQNGSTQFLKQNEAKVSHAPKIHMEDAQIVWTNPVDQVYNHIRGMAPYPGAWTTLDGIVLKILKTRRYEMDGAGKPGTLQMIGKSLIIHVNGGSLEIQEVQLAGKRRMKINEFLNGYTIKNWSLT
jgi:methionyl-tRNA formyltransferase